MHRVLLVVYEGIEALDAAGPAEVFSAALGANGERAYSVVTASSTGEPARSASGVFVLPAKRLDGVRLSPDDTVLVVGGQERALRRALRDDALRAFLTRAAPRVRRIGSVCSGAFLLAAAGVLDGRRAATHWLGCDALGKLHPRVKVDANAIFVRDGHVWTSAGVTTGIDMALAMVEEDLGREAADRIASQLVLYLRRPGFQSQFSDALVAQREAGDPLGAAIAWARANLRKVDVPSLADRAGLSLRTLHRRCAEVMQTTPASLLEKLRVEHARTLLAAGTPVKAAAVEAGFGSPARLRRAFARQLGLGPSEYTMLHGPALDIAGPIS